MSGMNSKGIPASIVCSSTTNSPPLLVEPAAVDRAPRCFTFSFISLNRKSKITVTYSKERGIFWLSCHPLSQKNEGDREFWYVNLDCWREDFWPLWYQISRKSNRFLVGPWTPHKLPLPKEVPYNNTANNHQSKRLWKKRKRSNHRKPRKPWQRKRGYYV